jgi:Kef-type K+ transport system membrane component KefB
MKKHKKAAFYLLVIGGFFLVMIWTANAGIGLENYKGLISGSKVTTSSWIQFLNGLKKSLQQPLAILLLQIITIMIAARTLGFLCRKIGQPSVIGEIVAGIIFGPSLIGTYFPEFSSFLFPLQSLGNLQFLSQFGLILFMFVVGMELDLKTLKDQKSSAVIISHASIVIPFALGTGLAYFLYNRFAPDNVSFLEFALFIGISMSITAFPVLARIVEERGIAKTRLGTLIITCAAIDDITAWCILAALIAIVKAGTFYSTLYVLLIVFMYIMLMFRVIRPLLGKLADIYFNKTSLRKQIVAIIFVVLLVSAFTTEVIGVHSLFGAFVAGLIMPPNKNFRKMFIEKIEDIALVVLMPLFFVYTGLRMQVGLLKEPELIGICGMIILVAVVGKLFGSTLAAKFVGQNLKDSLSIGVLMNTRGLMELVVLNIGYDLGVINSEIFMMMVLMALATTFMTGPLLDMIERLMPANKSILSKDNILLSEDIKSERG